MNQESEIKLIGTMTLILGGVRSGKSRFGQSLAYELGGDDVMFVATAEARDAEMSRRIDLHQRSRPASWLTLEQPLDVGKTLTATPSLPRVVLVDCLTLLVSNVLLKREGDSSSNGNNAVGGIQSIHEQGVGSEVSDLIRLAQQRELHLVVVSGEVGMGVVPDHALGRLFRDLLGWANQLLASHATSTYLMVAGLPVNMTAISSNVRQAANELGRCDSKGVQR